MAPAERAFISIVPTMIHPMDGATPRITATTAPIRVRMTAFTFRSSPSLLKEIIHYFDDFSLEKGGTLLLRQNRIVAFVPLDNISEDPRKSFCFDFDKLNEVLSQYEDIDGLGIIHSHTLAENGASGSAPSKEDLEFYESFYHENPSIETLLFPIVYRAIEGETRIAWYRFLDGKLVPVTVKAE